MRVRTLLTKEEVQSSFSVSEDQALSRVPVEVTRHVFSLVQVMDLVLLHKEESDRIACLEAVMIHCPDLHCKEAQQKVLSLFRSEKCPDSQAYLQGMFTVAELPSDFPSWEYSPLILEQALVRSSDEIAELVATEGRTEFSRNTTPVSYTHLTLPTIYSV